MTSIKLTELPSATTKNDIDLIYVVQDSTSKKMSIQTLTAGFLTSIPGETFLNKGDQGSTITVNFQAASVQKLRLTQDATLSITNPPTDSVPHFIKLIIEQDGLKSDTPYSWHITFPNNVVFTGSYRAEGNNFVPTFPFGGGTVPTSVPGPVLSYSNPDVLTIYTNDNGANYFAWFESNESGIEISNSSFYNGVLSQNNIDNCLIGNSYIGTHINQGNVSSISGTTNNILLENTAFLMNLTGDLTFTGDFTGIDSVPNSYTQVKLFFIQDATGGRTVTFSMNDTINWIGGTAPTINPAASSISLVTIVRFTDDTNNATYYGWADTGVVTGGGGGGGSGTQAIILSVTDDFTAIDPGTNKLTIRMPYAMTLTGVRLSLTTAQTSGSLLTVDINMNGVSILGTKLTVDNTEKTSTTAATAATITKSALTDDAEITIDVDQIGDGTAQGLKVYLIGTA